MNRKHALLMILCCLIPLAAFAAISILRVSVNTVIYVAIALACPVMHLFMMRGMANHNHDKEHTHHQSQTSQAIDSQRHA